ncbi:LysR family transcriptional regulator [Nocardioides sp. CN2-186]|uniref:LysR family transcriptional regulator n=1 Tax=Nocardioides tweenelious TaxID=3156607 RepID=UPI0032B5E5BD
MELRQLEAFVAVADELHFGRAAQRVQIGQPALSELIQRLERELGARLFVRTTRKVSLTGAGDELLPRARDILDRAEAAKSAVRRVAAGAAGSLRIGITPPAAPVLVPYLVERFAELAPLVEVTVEQLWLPALSQKLDAGEIDVGVTCAITVARPGTRHEVFCAERLLVALRPTHPHAADATVELSDLAGDTLGMSRESLFPAWALSQQQVLTMAGISPPMLPLVDTDISARRWQEQDGVDWVMLIGSFTPGHDPASVKVVQPELTVPFVLQWAPERTTSAAVVNFVEMALSMDPPPGWSTAPAHRRHRKLA